MGVMARQTTLLQAVAARRVGSVPEACVHYVHQTFNYLRNRRNYGPSISCWRRTSRGGCCWPIVTSLIQNLRMPHRHKRLH